MCSYNLVNGHIQLREQPPAERRAQGRLGIPRLRHVGLVGDAQHRDRRCQRPRPGAAGQPVLRRLWARRSPAGQVPQSRLDNMVHRILRAMYEAGHLRQPAEPCSPSPRPADAAIAQEVEGAGRGAAEECGAAASAQRLRRAIDRSHRIECRHRGALRRRLRAGTAHRRSALTGRLSLPALLGARWCGILRRRCRPSRPWRPQPTVQFDPTAPMPRLPPRWPPQSQVAIVFVSQWASEGMDMPSLEFHDCIHYRRDRSGRAGGRRGCRQSAHHRGDGERRRPC